MIKTKWIEIDWCSDERTLAIKEKITKYQATLEVSNLFTTAYSCLICFPLKSFPEFAFDFIFLHLTGINLEDYDQYVVSGFSIRPISESELEYREHCRWVKQAYTDKPLPKINKNIFFYNNWQAITGFKFTID